VADRSAIERLEFLGMGNARVYERDFTLPLGISIYTSRSQPLTSLRGDAMGLKSELVAAKLLVCYFTQSQEIDMTTNSERQTNSFSDTLHMAYLQNQPLHTCDAAPRQLKFLSIN